MPNWDTSLVEDMSGPVDHGYDWVCYEWYGGGFGGGPEYFGPPGPEYSGPPPLEFFAVFQ